MKIPTIVGPVHMNAFAPAAGESWFALAGKFPGSVLGETTLPPVPRSDCPTDLYIVSDRLGELFCVDMPATHAARLGLTQRPATQEALVEPSGARPLWQEVPSWVLIGEEDRIILPAPAALHGRARRRAAHDRDPRRVARRLRLTAARGRRADPRRRAHPRGRLNRPPDSQRSRS